MRWIALVLGLGTLVVSTTTAQNRDLVLAGQPPQRRLALVIGNDSYSGSPLTNARADARSMAQALRRLSFDVTALEDGTRASILSAVRAFSGRLTASDLALVFYAGHGVQVENANYLIPVDFKGRSEDEVRVDAVSADELTRALRRARVAVLVLDACRNNPFSGQRSGGGGLAPVDARGLLVAYAAGAGETASDGPVAAGNGIYTSELVQVLGTPGRGLRETFFDVQRRVQTRTNGRQFPAIYSQLIDDVVLTPASAGTATPGALPATEALATAAPSPSRPAPVSSADAARPGEIRADPRVPGVQWVYIPPGTFEMGCTLGDSECAAQESPRHSVRLTRAFELMTTEVTVATTKAVGRTVQSQPASSRDDHPVVSINWDDASGLCRALAGRLPTEAEWEYAARGGAASARYPWGNESPVPTTSSRNGARFSSQSTIAVTSYAANGYGLYDMAGNVREWVADWYDPHSSGAQTDPSGPAFGSSRVLRGGSWNLDPRGLRVSFRSDYTPGSRNGDFGVRCARDIS